MSNRIAASRVDEVLGIVGLAEAAERRVGNPRVLAVLRYLRT